MSTHISDTEMTSNSHPHRADHDQAQRAWSASWLPGRWLTRNQAVTAMTIADQIGSSRMAPFIESWAAELGLSAEAAARAIERTTCSCGSTRPDGNDLCAECESVEAATALEVLRDLADGKEAERRGRVGWLAMRPAAFDSALNPLGGTQPAMFTAPDDGALFSA